MSINIIFLLNIFLLYIQKKNVFFEGIYKNLLNIWVTPVIDFICLYMRKQIFM